MAIETELKLHITQDQLLRLKRHPLLRRHAIEKARTLKLYSVYYDTPDLMLRQHAMALRLRRVGKQWIQTLKGGGGASAGLHTRNEWETPVAAEQLDLQALKLCGGKLPRGVRNHLQPVFVTDFTRNVRVLDYHGARIEVCMDSGEIRAGQGMCPISELELELVSGSPRQLFQLALEILDVVPAEVEHTSKAEYGYRLFSPRKPKVRKARLPDLRDSRDIHAAACMLIASCLEHVQANVAGALLKIDEEYLHQVRVGLRHLRVVISMIKRQSHDRELDDLHREVSDLCTDLGRARDWDVFVTQRLVPICTHLPEHEGLHKLLNTCERLRDKQLVELNNSLASQGFQRLLLRFGAWLHKEKETDSHYPALPKALLKILDKRSDQVQKAGRTISTPTPTQFHRLRIACKKLRYNLEMFSSLLANDRYKTYIKSLASLQDTLGSLNDIAVAQHLLDELENATRHDTLTLVRGWIEQDYAEHVSLFSKHWRTFQKRSRCWRKK